MNWQDAGGLLSRITNSDWLNQGQCNTLHALGERLPRQNGCVIADEVGMGKTRIAVALAKTVKECGGRVCVVIPPGLGAQWKAEFAKGGLTGLPEVVHSLKVFHENNGDEGWLKEKIVLVSHFFTNWQIQVNSPASRWGLLPLLYRLWHKKEHGNIPWGSGNCFNEYPALTRLEPLADLIYRHCRPRLGVISRRLREQNRTWRWLCDPVSYTVDLLRPDMEKIIGLGLGRFDLVIIDEAHKARRSESNLTRLLDNVLWRARDCRYLAMTATPVELGVEDWRVTLGRVGFSGLGLNNALEAARNYAASLQTLRRCWRTDAAARENFENMARAFYEALSPYVLRRDKREDEAVIAWRKNKGDFFSYRQVTLSAIEPLDLPLAWKRALCASEAFSVIAGTGPLLKRVRLTVGNGHGIAAVLDTPQHDEELDAAQDKDSEEQDKNDSPTSLTEYKRQERIKWWEKNLAAPFAGHNNPNSALFEHPAILKAAGLIESITAGGEKVLVFGRFTRPLRILTALLNAREMIRRLAALDKGDQGMFWPQEGLGSDRPAPKTGLPSDLDPGHPPDLEPGLLRQAVIFALKQMGHDWSLEEVDDKLKKQYGQQATRRESFRKALVASLEKGLAETNREHGGGSGDRFVLDALDRLRQAEPANNERNIFLNFSNAVMEITGFNQESSAFNRESVDIPRKCAEAFEQLVNTFTDPAEDYTEGTEDATLLDDVWASVCDYLKEYSAPRGTFARLMYGPTSLPARRVMQAAFNRAEAWPRVLVAQSLVGREGLNLHESCRHVVLLHPEWNPGVVEQQIGRVDRYNSLWSRYVQKNIFDKPITVHPVIFQETYDEHNWKVLFERWMEWRAQLQGEIIPPHDISPEDELTHGDILEKIRSHAPRFSPGL